jgi:two-component system chemotaxis response regulator CheB
LDLTTKILIVDDNVIYRKMLTRTIGDMEGVELIAPAPNGRTALTRLQHKEVDLILLDMQMPGMDGLETLKRIRERHPDVGVIMISGEYESDAEVVIRALQMGAIDFLPKISSDAEGGNLKVLRSHLNSLMHQFQGRKNLKLAKKIASVNRSNKTVPPQIEKPSEERSGGIADRVEKSPGMTSPLVSPRTVLPSRVDVIVIGVSTGGPNALNETIPKLPGDIGIPILIVLHMPAFLTPSLAHSLDIKSALRVKEAREGEPLMPNTVYVAPGGMHLLIKNQFTQEDESFQRLMRLSDDPPENSVRPSADVLFRSAAEAFDGHILAVIMTGMGYDGMKGVRAMKKRGCYCITQAEETCVVYGMPRAVDEAGLSDERVPLNELASRIVDLVKGSPKRRRS